MSKRALLRSILPGVVQVPLLRTSAFLLLDHRITLIDTGLRGSTARLLAAVRLAGRSPEQIERIVITHCHPDHLGGLAELQKVLPARTAIHAIEAPEVQSAEGPPPPFASAAVRRILSPVRRRAFFHRPVRIDELLRDGDELPVLGGMRVIHTPGHTAGHIALYFPRMALLIAGDALEHRGGRLAGPAAAFTADMSLALRSIAKLAELEVDVVAFSHFTRIPAGAGKRLRELAGAVARDRSACSL